KYGAFLGCSGYPKCKYTQKIPVLGDTIPMIERLYNNIIKE
ncbi:MAG: hypothetical protein HDT19_06405, partial [Oscillibacter sp.]|nr:hypothetical protein [Oscillibacter sp.]